MGVFLHLPLILFFLCLLPCLTWAIVGGVTSRPPEPDEPVLFTPNARVEGLRKNSNGLYSFLGLPYAHIHKRFTRPEYQRLSGDVNATLDGPPCAQPDPTDPSKIIGSEDCLLLNVFSPQMPDGVSALPVLVWIHGGGFRFGSAHQYVPDPLTEHRVVVVVLQYRLGTLGILGSGRREFPGNLALLDCAMALRWVSEHIAHFGGDPDKVKLMGHGSGAVMAMHLTTSPFSSRLISGVIAMSGSLLTRHSLEDSPAESVDQVAELNQCSGKSDDPRIIIQCLRQRKLKDLIQVDNKIAAERLQKRGIESGLTGFLNFLPHIEPNDDDRGLPGFLTESPTEMVQKKHLPRVPLLIGVTGQETAKGLNLQAIKGAWGSYDHFLKNLTSSQYLKQLVTTLAKPVNMALPLHLPDVAKYLSIPDTLSPLAVLARITEISTDVLFNLPATLMADAWSQAAPSFLYQFDYSGKNAVRGTDIFPVLPLTSQGAKREKATDKGEEPAPVAHGDELAYLFDLRDMSGRSLQIKPLSGEEEQVRRRFTKLITDFASFSGNATKSDLFQSPFSGKGSSFIQINEQLNVKKDFRFCALSLWGAPLESSSGKTDCKSLLPSWPSIPFPLPPKMPGMIPGKPGGSLVNKGGSSGGFLGIF